MEVVLEIYALSGTLHGCVNARRDWLGQQVKEKITNITNIPWREQRLLAGEHELHDANSLDCLPSGDTVSLTLLRRSALQAKWLAAFADNPSKALSDLVRRTCEEAFTDSVIMLAAAEAAETLGRETDLIRIFSDSSQLLWEDRDFVLTAARLIGSSVLSYAPGELNLWSDQQFAAVMCQRSSHFLELVPEGFRSDKGFMLAVCETQADALYYAAPPLKENREFVLAVMRSCGWALQYAPDKYRADYEIVHAAVQQNRFALEFASWDLQKDPRLVA